MAEARFDNSGLRSGLFTLHDSVSGAADGDYVVIPKNRSTTIVASLSGASPVGVPEVSLDGLEWRVIAGRRLDSPEIITAATSILVFYVFDATGAGFFRVRLTSGTGITVVARMSHAIFQPATGWPAALSTLEGGLKVSVEEHKRWSQSDTFTAAGNGVALDVSSYPPSAYAIQVVGVGAAATAWSIVLEGSLDGENYTTILTHGTLTGNGVVLFSGTNRSPATTIRSRVVSVTLGSATAVSVYITGAP